MGVCCFHKTVFFFVRRSPLCASSQRGLKSLVPKRFSHKHKREIRLEGQPSERLFEGRSSEFGRSPRLLRGPRDTRHATRFCWLRESQVRPCAPPQHHVNHQSRRGAERKKTGTGLHLNCQPIEQKAHTLPPVARGGGGEWAFAVFVFRWRWLRRRVCRIYFETDGAITNASGFMFWQFERIKPGTRGGSQLAGRATLVGWERATTSPSSTPSIPPIGVY
ncbi:hypothetical protein BJV74DRAFT_109564 [Russula compacta]|nr:hypothetical protein BJV74DRAFT_109564 [Russula compacta]